MTEDDLVLGDVQARGRVVARYDATGGDDLTSARFNAWVLQRWAERVAGDATGPVDVALVDTDEHDDLQLAAIDRERREATIAAPLRGESDVE